MSESANHLSATDRNGRRPETAGEEKGSFYVTGLSFSSFREEYRLSREIPGARYGDRKGNNVRAAGGDSFHLFSESSAFGGRDAVSLVV